MSSILARFRRKSHGTQGPEDQTGPVERAPATASDAKNSPEKTFQPPPGPPPSHNAASATVAPDVHYLSMNLAANDPGVAAHGMRQMGSNVGMVAGALAGEETGGNPVTGMIEGQVVGTMIAQRVNQIQRHQYWREQALNHRAGLPADGIGSGSGVLPPMPDVRDANAPESRSERREERRRSRWERQAARRDGKKVDDSLGSDRS
jgi:hypothetical protein